VAKFSKKTLNLMGTIPSPNDTINMMAIIIHITCYRCISRSKGARVKDSSLVRLHAITSSPLFSILCIGRILEILFKLQAPELPT
jgi:hypothetical protein